jgi:uncharacterized RmlC-like cupin family protein
MSSAVEKTFAGGCRIVSGGLVADNAADAGGASGALSRGAATSAAGMWMGVSELPGGGESIWHHHADQTTMVFILRGVMAFYVRENDEETTFQAGPGDIAVIPAGVVHREHNPGSEGCVTVVVRDADSPVVVNL